MYNAFVSWFAIHIGKGQAVVPLEGGTLYMYMEMFDLDPASWAALVAQLVRACLKCRVSWVQIPPEATHFHFFIAWGVFLSFFLSISSVIMYHVTTQLFILKFMFFNIVNQTSYTIDALLQPKYMYLS